MDRISKRIPNIWPAGRPSNTVGHQQLTGTQLPLFCMWLHRRKLHRKPAWQLPVKWQKGEHSRKHENHQIEVRNTPENRSQNKLEDRTSQKIEQARRTSQNKLEVRKGADERQTNKTNRKNKKKIEKYTSRTEFAKLETLRSAKHRFLVTLWKTPEKNETETKKQSVVKK